MNYSKETIDLAKKIEAMDQPIFSALDAKKLGIVIKNIAAIEEDISDRSNYKTEKEYRTNSAKALKLTERLKALVEADFEKKSTLREFIELDKSSYLLESKADDALTKLIDGYEKDISGSEGDEKKELVQELGEKVKEYILRLIKNIARDSIYIDTPDVIKTVKAALKSAGIDDEEIAEFVKASSGDAKDREKYEFDVMKDIAGVEEKGRKKKAKEEKAEKEEKDEDADTVAKGKKALSDEETAKMEKEAEEELNRLAGPKKGAKKILLAIAKKVDGDDVSDAIIGETEMSQTDIEGLEYEDDVMNAIVNGRKATTPAQIAKRIKELNGTKVYFFSEKKKDASGEPWIVLKIK